MGVGTLALLSGAVQILVLAGLAALRWRWVVRRRSNAPVARTERTPASRQRQRGAKTGFTPQLRNRIRQHSKAVVGLSILVSAAIFFVLSLTALDLGGVTMPVHKRWLAAKQNIKQKFWFQSMWRYVSPGARATQQKALDYYKSQRPYFERAWDGFELHPYWAHTELPKGREIGWYEMIGLRAAAMKRQLDEAGLDGYRLEKDKCEMYRFFLRNRFRLARIRGFWQSQPKDWTRDQKDHAKALRQFLKVLASADDPETELLPRDDEALNWPVFIKSCHLTQGSADSTIRVKSRAAIVDGFDELTDWCMDKWSTRADDWYRPWAAEMNALTDTLLPGFMLQQPFPLSWNDMDNRYYCAEIKVEVFWGRAYLAGLPGFGRDSMVLRDGSIEIYRGWWSNMVNAHIESPYLKWVREEGHLPRVWALAEAAAHVMGIDQVRIDIFVFKGHPDALVINENSLSSGVGYRAHFEYMTKLWVDGHRNRKYKLFNTTVKPYELSHVDGTAPNAARTPSLDNSLVFRPTVPEPIDFGREKGEL